MNKTCPDCSHELTKNDYRKFLKEQAGDWMHCENCEGKMYIVIPEKNRIIMILLNVLAFLPLFVIACVVTYLWFMGGLTSLSNETSRGDVRIFVAALFAMIGLIYLTMTFASRAIHWKLAVAQKSPFV